MNKHEKRALREEFYTWVLETNAKLLEVLAQNKVRGGVLGKTRLRAREVINGSFRESDQRK